jgi:predicted O-linked N-acetylglucosamine transferase (SPINDLY family)
MRRTDADLADAFAHAADAHRHGQLDAAESGYRRILADWGEHPDALHLLGLVARQRGDREKALELFERAAGLRPDVALFRRARAALLQDLGREIEAADEFSAALRLEPDRTETLLGLGLSRLHLGERERAGRAFRAALALAPAQALAMSNLAATIPDTNLSGAIGQYFRRAVCCAPDFAAARINLGISFRARHWHQHAERQLRIGIALDPANADAHNAFASGEDIGSYARALAIEPRHIAAAQNSISAFIAGGALRRAETDLAKLLALRPTDPLAIGYLGNLRKAQGRYEESAAAMRRAIALDPGVGLWHANFGGLLHEVEQPSLACIEYARAMGIDPNSAQARLGLLSAALPSFHWTADEQQMAHRLYAERLDETIEYYRRAADRRGEATAIVGHFHPFYLAYSEIGTIDLNRRYGDLVAELMAAAPAARQRPSARPVIDRDVRVAIVTAFAKRHSVWLTLGRGWVTRLGRKGFKLGLFMTGSESDELTDEAISAVDHAERGTRTLGQWVDAICDWQPDVIVYPEIGMDPMTIKLAALRLAPLQSVSWGHPDTSGLPTIDVFLGADLLEPPQAECHYRERLIRLPCLGCYYDLPNGAPYAADRTGLGVEMGDIVYLCGQSPFKYLPQHDGILVAIAQRVPRARFLLFEGPRQGSMSRLRNRLAAAFAAAGNEVDTHCRFLPRMNSERFRAVHGAADIYLDTVGFSGFNTAMEAVASNLPIVTCRGRFLRGRLAAGVMTAVGLADMVADDVDRYIDLAVDLGKSAVSRLRFRERLAKRYKRAFRRMEPIDALADLLSAAKRL